MSPESFLAQYVTENIGPFGAVGRFPLGIVGSMAGVPGIGPGFQQAPPIDNLGGLGGLLGLGIKSLF